MYENMTPVSARRFEFLRSRGEKDFHDCFFTDLRFTGDLRGFDFSGSRFMSCKFLSADISEAQFVGSTVNAEFQETTARGANFQQASLYCGRMKGCDLGHADFTGASLRHMLVDESDLSHADLTSVEINASSFSRLSGVTGITGIHTMSITMGGATASEVENLTRQIFRALTPDGTPSPMVGEAPCPEAEDEWEP